MNKYWEKDLYLVQDNKQHGPALAQMNLRELPNGCIGAWRSNRFLVQVFEQKHGGQRISINRTRVCHETGRWVDGITWDEIQQIKRELGFGDRVAVEIYPADDDVINVANMRHIWLLDEAPVFMWRKYGR